MLQFKPISIEDRDLVCRYTSKISYGTTETAFVDLFIWGENYRTCIAEESGFLFIRVGEGENCAYLFPYGDGEIEKAISILQKDAEVCGRRLRFVGVVREAKEILERAFPDRFVFNETRENFDYVYLASSIINLPGRKLHSKRTNINKFMAQCGERFSFEEITKENIGDVRKFQENWLAHNLATHDSSLYAENDAIARAFDNFDAIGIRGGILRIDGEIAAYSLGTPINDEFYLISVEKANTEYPGIYQVINKLYAEHFCGGYKYINREEDMGDEGLRQAKLSYRPELLIEKYEVFEK